MLVNIHHDSRREHNRLLVAGIVFLTGMALLIAFSIAVYQKRFDKVTTIEIHADRAGLQLAKFGDVRINGVLTATWHSRPETRPARRCLTASRKASAAGRPTPRPPAPG